MHGNTYRHPARKCESHAHRAARDYCHSPQFHDVRQGITRLLA